MPRKKLQRFEEIKTMNNVLSLPENMKGEWFKYFGNTNPITLELGCGKGEYTVQMAKMFPERNFIGIDIQGERIWFGAKKAIEEKLTNLAFLRIQIEHLQDYFTENEIQEIWITFPDPHPKKGNAKRRLTSPRFLELYHAILPAKGLIHLKTDAKPLFDYTKEILTAKNIPIVEETVDLHSKEGIDPVLKIETTFERKFLLKGKPICYLRWQVPEKN